MKKLTLYLSIIAGLIILILTDILRLSILLPGVFGYFHFKQIIYVAAIWHTYLEAATIIIVLTGSILVIIKNRKAIKYVIPTVVFTIAGVLLFNYVFNITSYFKPLSNKTFGTAATNNNVDSNAIVMGVVVNGVAKAYPLAMIAYHHDIIDELNGMPLFITYCSLCHSGRIYNIGKTDKFELIGQSEGNAIFQDAATKSWWQQSTGIAIAGPEKGKQLQAYSFEQLRLGAWLREHPTSQILQPDEQFIEKYNASAEGFYARRDSMSWKDNSWIVTVLANSKQKAFDWNKLLRKTVLNCKVDKSRILVFVEKDNISFHVWDRMLNGTALRFRYDKITNQLLDSNTLSVWDEDGYCISGKLKGVKLKAIPAYQENWHAFQQSNQQSYILH